MVRDPARELADLTTVHAFYVETLQDTLGHPIPVPAGLSQAASAPGPDRLAVGLNILRRWLNLLDLALSPPMLRHALRKGANDETAEALLRYFVLKLAVTKQSLHASDRDKADLIVSHIYRQRTSQHTRLAANDRGLADEGPEFERYIMTTLEYSQMPPLPEEHRQLANEFQFIRQEVEDIRYFDQLMDSGILDRVRDIKARFGTSFYHPRVLATVAEHNAFFGHLFDELFHDAARQIKAFATRVQQEGGSTFSRVDGDITVKHLAEVEEGAILQQEYERARAHFHRVSSYKKAVDRRGPKGPPAPPPPVKAPAPSAMFNTGVNAAVVPPEKIDVATLAEAPARAMANSIEESKMRSMEESIRNFVKAADRKSAYVVPLRGGSITLTTHEVDAFLADFGREKSFRSEYNNVHRHVVAVQARIISELEEFKTKQDSAYLWKPHADSLAYLIDVAQRDITRANAVLEVATQRGLTDKVTSLNASLQKLRWELQRAAKTLEGLNPPKPQW